MHLNVNIESMDMFSCLYIVDYIFYSISNTILYSMLVLFAVVEMKFLRKWDWKKLNKDLLQLSGIRYDSRSLSVRCLVSLAYWEMIDFSCLAVCCGTAQSIGSFSL